VPIVPENAALIRAFVRARRSQRPAGPKTDAPQIRDLEHRLYSLLQDVKQHLRTNMPIGTISYLKDTAYTALRKWGRIARRLEEMDPRRQVLPSSGAGTEVPPAV
jgi:hypothetical protein